MKDATLYYEAADEALAKGVPVSAVLDRKRFDAARRTLQPDKAADLDEERERASASLAAIEQKEAQMREDVSQWEGMLEQRDRLRTRLANVGSLRQQLAASSKEFSSHVLASVGHPSSDYNYVHHAARAGNSLAGIERFAKLIEEAEPKFSGELTELESSMRCFAAKHGFASGLDEPERTD